MNPDILEAVFPVKSEWLTLALEPGQTLCEHTTQVELRLVCWEFDTEAKVKTVGNIYQQDVQLLPEDAVEPDPERVESYLLALGLTLERAFSKANANGFRSYTVGYAVLDAISFGWNHPLLLAKAETVEDFIKALETKGRLGKWL